MSDPDRPSGDRPPAEQPEHDTVGADTLQRIVRQRVADRDELSRQALAAAARRTRRSWRIGAVVGGVLVVALAAFMVTVWHSSEIRHVSVRPATVSPSPLPTPTLGATLTQRWHNSDRLAVGTPVWQDVVVTWSAHTVTGRDVRTGATRWTYTRTDRRVCTVAAGAGTAAAIFEHDGNCDEVTGLDMGRGTRSWTRTFFENGTDFTVSVRGNSALIRTDRSLHLFDLGGGLDFWYIPNVADTPCDIGSAVLGAAGVLMTQDCNGTRTLILESTGNKDGRPTQIWAIPQDGYTPLAADTTVAALATDGSSIAVFGEKGKVARTIRLAQAVAPASAPFALGVLSDQFEVIAVRGRLLGLSSGGSTVLWQRTGSALPVAYGDGIALPADGRVLDVSAVSGDAQSTTSASGLSADASITPADTGIVAGGSSGTTVYLGG